MDILQGTERTIVQRLATITLVTVVALGFGFRAHGQTPSASPQTPAVASLIGEVKAIDATARQMVIREDTGVIVTINLSDKTQYKRLAPGEKSLANATNIAIGDVGQVDRVLARWPSSSYRKSLPHPQCVCIR